MLIQYMHITRYTPVLCTNHYTYYEIFAIQKEVEKIWDFQKLVAICKNFLID